MPNAFQNLKSLSQRKKNKKANTDKPVVEKTFLCTVVDGQKIYVDTDAATEVMARVDVTPVGHTVTWFKGLIKVQAEIYGLVDIAHFLHVSPVNCRKGYVIALARRYDNVAIAVDHLEGLHSFNMLNKIEKKEYTDIFQTEQGEIQVLSVKRLLSSDEFFDISVFNHPIPESKK